ncbi:MAG: tetratricopeptide repeat protein [bacterium]
MSKRNKKIIAVYKNNNTEHIVPWQWILLTIILLIGFVLRFLFARKATMIPFNFLSDSSQYTHWAKTLLQGKEFIDVFHQSPLYPYFLALIFSCFGSLPIAPLIVQSLLGTFCCFLVYLLSLEVFENRWIGIVSAFIMAVYGPSIFYCGMLLIATLATTLNLLVLLFLMKAIKSTTKKMWALAGVFLGLSAIARGSILIFIPIALIYLMGKVLTEDNKKNSHFIRDRFILPSLMLLAGTFLVISPVTLRNALKGKDYVLIAANAGITFYEGNNPWATGMYMDPPGLDLAEDFNGGKIASYIEKRTLLPSEISKFWFTRSWRFIKNNPWAYFKLLGKKCAYFWNRYEIPNAENYYFAKQYSLILSLPLLSFFLIGPLGLLGIAIYFIKGKRKVDIVLLFLLSHMLGTVLFFITARYRLPVIPILVIFMSYAIFALIDTIKSKNNAHLALFALIGAIFFIFVIFPWRGINPKRDYASSYTNVGILFHLTGNLQKALRYYEMAIAHDPTFIKAYNNLGGAFYSLGREQEAMKQWQRGLSHDPNSALIHMNLGNVYYTKGELHKAKKEYARAVKGMPYSIKMQKIKDELALE